MAGFVDPYTQYRKRAARDRAFIEAASDAELRQHYEFDNVEQEMHIQSTKIQVCL
jgi:hypothetical protein